MTCFANVEIGSICPGLSDFNLSFDIAARIFVGVDSLVLLFNDVDSKLRSRLIFLNESRIESMITTLAILQNTATRTVSFPFSCF